jgi:cell wall-associated NlpC family hydrolase
LDFSPTVAGNAGSGEAWPLPVTSPLPRHFALSGPSITLDPRIHAWRNDIADIALAGQLFAPHYAQPLIRSCGMIPTMVRQSPSDEAAAISELLPGERFAVLDITAGWAWGYCCADHRVGYVEAIELTDPLPITHVVVEANAPIQPGPDPLAPALSSLPMGSRLSGHVHGALLAIEGGFVPLSYLHAADAVEDDAVAVARRMLGAHFLPGGRTCRGIDSPGLVQLALQLCGIDCPRDIDMQRSLGEAVPASSVSKRGDIAFCDQMVGLMVDDQMVIHVNESLGRVTVEPLRCVGALLERRRL